MNNTKNEIELSNKFMWNVIVLMSCFIGTTICGIIAVVYTAFFK
jgi:hypothetical protein